MLVTLVVVFSSVLILEHRFTVLVKMNDWWQQLGYLALITAFLTFRLGNLKLNLVPLIQLKYILAACIVENNR